MATTDWKGAIAKLMPTVGQLLTAPLGPLAPLAQTALNIIGGVLLGKKPEAPNTTESEIAEAVAAGLTPDQIIALKRADNEFQTKMAEVDLQIFQASVADRSNAREMQQSIKSKLPATLAMVLHIILCGMLVALFAKTIPAENRTPFDMVLGGVIAGCTQVWNFVYGSSAQDRHKDATISAIATGP